MSEVPSNLHYTKTHEWVRIKGNILFAGITDFAQEALTEVVWVDLAEVGTTVQAMGACASVESVKSVSEINSPVSGEVLESNTALEDNPEMINENPYETVGFSDSSRLTSRILKGCWTLLHTPL